MLWTSGILRSIHFWSGFPRKDLPRIRWLTTSRAEPASRERLGRGHQLHTSLELNLSHAARAVANLIDRRVDQLAKKWDDSELQKFVLRMGRGIHGKAGDLRTVSNYSKRSILYVF